jgi:pyruvate/2-oxoglutarate dehydrogenase complex dihydrolipoamide acyltransferase (E2) component
MRHTVKLPKLGDMTEGVLVVEWLVSDGDSITAGDALFRAETDKVDADVPSPISGTLVEKLVAEQDEVANGDPIAVITSD